MKYEFECTAAGGLTLNSAVGNIVMKKGEKHTFKDGAAYVPYAEGVTAAIKEGWGKLTEVEDKSAPKAVEPEVAKSAESPAAAAEAEKEAEKGGKPKPAGKDKDKK